MTTRSRREVWDSVKTFTSLSLPSFGANDKIAIALDTCEKEFGRQVESIKEITSIPNPDKAVLLVQFAGGFKIKLCISTPSDYRFDTASPFADLIKDVRFSKVLFRGESWAVFEWIEGKPVSELPFSNQITDAAARVLKSIHEAKIKVGTDIRLTTLNEVRLRLQKSTPLLIEHGIISDAESQFISDLHNSLRPETLNISLIHGDFSPANLVVCENELCVVDNERMRVHVTDYDVCRASTSWEEWALCGQSFLDAYQRQSTLAFDPVSLRFWEIYDLVYRISYRISACPERNDFCIMKLKGILATGVRS